MIKPIFVLIKCVFVSTRQTAQPQLKEKYVKFLSKARINKELNYLTVHMLATSSHQLSVNGFWSKTSNVCQSPVINLPSIVQIIEF